ncbi:MAG: DUF5666 domain-containing protein, partial [Anaerolineae bacterium]|nr:DUF5666 domain-containing protein [Anaerolineae bacterium]
MFRKLVKTSVILMAALMLVTAALAHPATQAEKIRGTVTAIDEAGGTFTVLTEAGDTVLVTAPEGFDWNSISVGGAVMVFGSPDEDGNVEATKVVDPTGDDDDDGGAGKGKGKGGDDDDGAGKGKGKGQSDGGD